MKSDKYIALIYKQLKGEIRPEEAANLRTWEAANPTNAREADAVRRTWKESENYDLPFDLDMDSDFAKVQSRLNPTAKTVQMPARRNSWLRIAAAGAILVIAGFLVRSYFAAETAWSEVTAMTEIEEFQLADGTKVWLNVGSTLSYPADFSGTQRGVKLSGEAYFEVTKDAEKRFQIETKETVVTVLGTAFNVRENLNDKLTEVAVTEGKVQVEAVKSAKKVILSVNEKAVYNHAAQTLEEMPDTDLNDAAWKRGVLKFNDTTLANALSEIGKFYNINISLSETDLQSCPFSGLYYTKKGLNSTLEDIAQQYKFTIETGENGEDIMLRGGVCL